MVVTIKRRIICRGGVSPPALKTERFTAKFVNLLLLYLSGGEPPPLRMASLIHLSPTANFIFIEHTSQRRSPFGYGSHDIRLLHSSEFFRRLYCSTFIFPVAIILSIQSLRESTVTEIHSSPS